MNRIKQLRNERGIKQGELAKHLGVAQNTLSYWENAKFEPDIDTIIKIAAFFQVSTDYLLGLTDSCYEKDDIDIPAEFIAIARKASTVSAETRKHLYQLLDSTIDNVLAALDTEKSEGNKGVQGKQDGSF